MKHDFTKKKAIIAFGGNALLREHEEGTLEQQKRNAHKAAKSIMQVIKTGYNVAIVHGNGPQVGYAMIKVEEAVTKIPSVTLDVCVAETQGTMAYLIENALRNNLTKINIQKNIVSIISEVVVDEHDPNFDNPTKPIGHFYTKYRAKILIKEKKWMMKEDSGRGFRKVVASPKPIEILSALPIKQLMDLGYIVISGGGGGIPVIRSKKNLIKGVEAVIDKDYTACLLAKEVKADLLIILTAIDHVYLNYGTDQQQLLSKVSLVDLKKYHHEGHFAEGSMGPKIEACISFIESGGKAALITSDSNLKYAMYKQSGTWIVLKEKDFEQLELF